MRAVLHFFSWKTPRGIYFATLIPIGIGFAGPPDLLAAERFLDFNPERHSRAHSIQILFTTLQHWLICFLRLLRSPKGVWALAYAFLHTGAVALAGPLITDPIADYLGMNVPDRIANVGRLLVIKKVEVDLEGNGKNDVFVGTWYRNSGPDTWLWAGYAPTADGYERITPANSDVLIDFDGIYVGDLPDVGRHGMAQAYSLELTNKDRDQSNMISDLTFYYIEDGRLAQQGTGALDRDDPDQEAIFQHYFGPDRKLSETPRIESFTVIELAKRGYRIPNWRPSGVPGTK